KYQGRHGNRNETYTSIDRHIDRNIDHLSYIAEQAALGVSSQRNFGFRFHVLTVRNRWFQFSPTLSEALATLDSGGWRYENIHCSFCRNPMLSFSPPSANATPFGACARLNRQRCLPERGPSVPATGEWLCRARGR